MKNWMFLSMFLVLLWATAIILIGAQVFVESVSDTQMPVCTKAAGPDHTGKISCNG